MGFKPDYGLRLAEDGVGSDVDVVFHNFRLTSVTVLGKGEYSTMVEMPYKGKVCALSIDFNQAILEAILERANSSIVDSTRTLIKATRVGGTIDLEGQIEFGIRTRLGKLQSVQKEQFIPLVGQEIVKKYGA